MCRRTAMAEGIPPEVLAVMSLLLLVMVLRAMTYEHSRHPSIIASVFDSSSPYYGHKIHLCSCGGFSELFDLPLASSTSNLSVIS
ncbi:hypothetical protein GOBAR_DD11639 [Gossypium barbadense]|nr:hypothetical protein GOBAR_DD11639 [Gossypium barbadense]